jgi:catechol 2,3-dioxygenase-like lactoylglutathione lyase family enzyme
MNVPKVSGILETALYVDDLKVSTSFYKTIFQFETLFEDERLCALNVSDRQVLLLFLKRASNVAMTSSGGVIPPHDGDGNLHFAFSIAASELEPWENWLRKNEVAIESTVQWNRGGTSLYFRDPDNHLLELVTPGLWTIY